MDIEKTERGRTQCRTPETNQTKKIVRFPDLELTPEEFKLMER
jgi:hypothetical protein